MSTPANVENKYVKLHETSTTGSPPPKVTFYGECIDASGTDLEEWGFFYSTMKTQPTPTVKHVERQAVMP